jgi:hypothetical protein
VLSRGNYFPMNLWADTKFGKNMLLGTDWDGFLFLKEKEQKARFMDYLLRKGKS